MHARRLKDLVQCPIPERLDVIAEGLELLTEQQSILREDVLFLHKANRRRGCAALGAIADEEAAKTLILLDLIRGGRNDQKQVRRQFGRFYDHLARGIYAELCGMRPGDFAEVRRFVVMCRPSRSSREPLHIAGLPSFWEEFRHRARFTPGPRWAGVRTHRRTSGE